MPCYFFIKAKLFPKIYFVKRVEITFFSQISLNIIYEKA